MKTQLTVLALLLSSFLKAQITLEHTYPVSQQAFSVYKLDVSGIKYLVDSSTTTDFKFKLYNTNHTLFKSIDFPNPFPSYFSHVKMLVSENLFDLDPEIEFAVDYSTNPTLTRFVIFNEDGSILFNKPNANLYSYGAVVNSNGGYSGIIPTPAGTKMILTFNNPIQTRVYSIPGSLACWECIEGNYSGNREGLIEEPNNLDSKIYPNPSSSEAVIEYQLPNECKQASLSVYSLSGALIKTFLISSDFKNLILSNEDLPSGTYFYRIETPNGVIDGKQFIIVQ